jgi:hypothetical protein
LNRTVLCLSLALLAAAPSTGVLAQSYSTSSTLIVDDYNLDGAAGQAILPARGGYGPDAPFSRVAFSVGGSTMGINLQAATNVNRYLNLRGTSNIFNYTTNNITTNGFNFDAKANLASAGASVDFYPFPSHGFRISPGALFYNTNSISGNFNVAGGTSFSLNNTTYYASSSNPIVGNGGLGLHTTNPAFTVTTGWGNMIPHRDKHWSFPLEVGVAFIGAPSLNMALTSGQACDSEGANCVNVATDPGVQANLAAQIAKYNNDLNPLKYYPILSSGIAYSFHIR